MFKKGLWLLLGAAFIWIAVDFARDTAQEKADNQQATVALSSIDSTNPAEEYSYTEESDTQEDSSELEIIGEDFDKATKMTVGSDLGQTAYDFELMDMDGKTVKLSDYRGKKVFLNFWASWCPPCRAEMPHLQAFSDKQDEVVVLGVNATPSESNIDNVKEFLDEQNITFTNVYRETKQADQFRTQSLPTSYFIGADGVIYDKVVGPVTSDALEVRFEMIQN